MNLLTHILKFVGVLFIMGILTHYIPFGYLVSAAICFAGIWKITE